MSERDTPVCRHGLEACDDCAAEQEGVDFTRKPMTPPHDDLRALIAAADIPLPVRAECDDDSDSVLARVVDADGVLVGRAFTPAEAALVVALLNANSALLDALTAQDRALAEVRAERDRAQQWAKRVEDAGLAIDAERDALRAENGRLQMDVARLTGDARGALTAVSNICSELAGEIRRGEVDTLDEIAARVGDIGTAATMAKPPALSTLTATPPPAPAASASPACGDCDGTGHSGHLDDELCPACDGGGKQEGRQ